MFAAQQAANADTIQVQGETIGVPTVAPVNVSALTAASSAATASRVAQDIARRQEAEARDRGSMTTVDVLGFGLN